MQCKKIVFSGHAIKRMFERGINERQVSKVLAEGELIAEYPDDRYGLEKPRILHYRLVCGAVKRCRSGCARPPPLRIAKYTSFSGV